MKLSVVITAYNVEEYIKECILSVSSQNVENLEIIVVEDKSTDNTLDAIKSTNLPIKVFQNEVNVGAGLSRRFGIEQATGDYIMLLDGDDYLENSNHLKELLETAEKTNADVVSGGIKILKEDGSYDITSYGNHTFTGYEKVSKFWGERIVFMNNKIIRRSLYDKIKYCHRRYIEDTPVIIPILWLANKVVYVDSIGYNYRMRSTSLTHTTNLVKDIIYKGLCWCDLMEFFNVNDKEVYNHVNIPQYIANIFNTLNNITLKAEDIQPYINDFTELMFRLVNLVQFTNIKFKNTVNPGQQ